MEFKGLHLISFWFPHNLNVRLVLDFRSQAKQTRTNSQYFIIDLKNRKEKNHGKASCYITICS